MERASPRSRVSFKFIQVFRRGPEHRGDPELLFVQVDAGGHVGVCADEEAGEAADQRLVFNAEALAEAGDVASGPAPARARISRSCG